MTSRLALCGLSLLLIAGCGSAVPPEDPPPPRLDVAQEPVQFGRAAIGVRATRQLVFSNPASIHRGVKLRIDGALASEFSAPETLTVAPGESAAVDLWFMPAGEGLRTARLIYSAGEETGSVELAGSGLRPRLAVAGSLDFGATLGPTIKTLWVGNAADLLDPTAADLVFGTRAADGTWESSAPTIEGENAADFKIVSPAQFSSVRVEPDAGVAIEVKFAPTVVGTRRATLKLRTNDPDRPDVRIALSGELAGPVACRLVAPERIPIDGVVGETQVRTLLVRNDGSAACRVSGVSFAPGSSAAFSTEAHAPFPIAAGYAVAVKLEFRPTVVGTAEATLVIESGDQRANVQMWGFASPPAFVNPLKVDFGAVLVCGARELSIELWPGYGASPWRVDRIELIGGPEFRLTQRPSLPAVLSRTLQIAVNYVPADAGEDTATLRIIGAGYSVDVPLSARGVMRAPVTDVFASASPPKVDVLFVIDDSPSMADKQQNVATNLERWFRTLQAGGLDYRVAVTTTSVDAAHGGAGSGPGFANGMFTPLDGSRPRVVAPGITNVAQIFAQNAAVGATTPSDGFLLRPVRLALSQPLLGAENDGFLRTDAHLAVILVSDGADQDVAVRVDVLAAFLVGLKGYQRSNMVSLSAVIPTLAAPPPGCTYDQPDAGQSTRVKDVVDRTGGVFDEICSPDWARSFELRVPRPWGYRPGFMLSRTPDMSATPDPIKVEIDGMPYAQYGAFGDKRWSYESTRNEIVFEPLAVPEPGSTLTITYMPACSL